MHMDTIYMVNGHICEAPILLIHIFILHIAAQLGILITAILANHHTHPHPQNT